MLRPRCWVSGRVLAGCRDMEEVPGETPNMGILPPGARGGPCFILPWLLYFDRVFVQCQTWLLCLLLIFVFSNDVCFMPPVPLPVPCWGSPRGPPRHTAALPHRGDGVPTLAPGTPAPSRGATEAGDEGEAAAERVVFWRAEICYFFLRIPLLQKKPGLGYRKL